MLGLRTKVDHFMEGRAHEMKVVGGEHDDPEPASLSNVSRGSDGPIGPPHRTKSAWGGISGVLFGLFSWWNRHHKMAWSKMWRADDVGSWGLPVSFNEGWEEPRATVSLLDQGCRGPCPR